MTARRRPERSAQVPPICRAIRHARADAGITTHELARRAGVSQSMVTRYETSREPTLDMIRVLEKALRLRRGELLRAAGYVPSSANGVSVVHALRSDARLDERARAALLASYRVLRKGPT